jgi:hypothetical protein
VLVWKNTSVICRRVPSVRPSAVGSEAGSNTVKTVLYVPPPQPLTNQPRQPRRVYPGQGGAYGSAYGSNAPLGSATTWSRDGADGGGGAEGGADDGAGGEAAPLDAGIAALVNQSANAWETEKAAGPSHSPAVAPSLELFHP